MTDETDAAQAQDDTQTDIAALTAEADGAAAAAVSDPIEKLARWAGWKPQDEWQGPPDQWNDATKFIEYGMKRSRESAEELRNLRKEVGTIGRTAEVLMRTQVENAVREAEQRFAVAVENKDPEGIRAARDDVARLTAAVPPVVPNETADFMTRNGSWFGSNPEATRIAHETTERLSRQGVSVADQLQAAENAVRAAHPQLFSERQAAKPAAHVSQPGPRAAQVRAGPKGANDLPAEARRAGQDFVKRGMVKTLDDYARVYFEEIA